MKKNWLNTFRKTLVFGIIILLIGVGFVPIVNAGVDELTNDENDVKLDADYDYSFYGKKTDEIKDDDTEEEMEILSVHYEQDIFILENGQVQSDLSIKIPPSSYANLYKDMLGVSDDSLRDGPISVPREISEDTDEEISVSAGRDAYFNSIQNEQWYVLGLQIDNFNSNEVSLDDKGNYNVYLKVDTKIRVDDVKGNICNLEFGPRATHDMAGATQYISSVIGYSKLMLNYLESKQCFKRTWETRIHLAENIDLLNFDSLNGKQWVVDYCYGTYMVSYISLKSNKEIVLHDTLFVSEDEDINPATLGDYNSFTLECEVSQGANQILQENIQDGDYESGLRWESNIINWTIPYHYEYNEPPIAVNAYFNCTAIVTIHVDVSEAYVEPHFYADGALIVDFTIGDTFEPDPLTLWSHPWFFYFQLGPVPVVILVEAKVQLNFLFKVEGYVHFETGFWADAWFRAGARYNLWEGFSTIWETGYDQDITPPTVTGGAAVTIRPSISFPVSAKIYGIIGPVVTPELYLEGFILYTLEQDLYWYLKVGFDIKIGVEVGIPFFFSHKWEWTIFDYEIKNISYPPGVDFEEVIPDSVDSEPPVTEIIMTPQVNGWTGRYTLIKFNATDYGLIPSGINYTIIQLPGFPPDLWLGFDPHNVTFNLTYTGPDDIVTGEYWINYTSFDYKNNLEWPYHTRWINTDAQPPTSSIQIPPGNTYAYETPITIEASDECTGYKIHYRIWNNGCWSENMTGDANSSVTFHLTSLGLTYIEYWAEDGVWNTEDKNNISVTVEPNVGEYFTFSTEGQSDLIEYDDHSSGDVTFILDPVHSYHQVYGLVSSWYNDTNRTINVEFHNIHTRTWETWGSFFVLAGDASYHEIDFTIPSIEADYFRINTYDVAETKVRDGLLYHHMVDHPPVARYTWEDADGYGSGTTIDFDASGSWDEYGIIEYAWDWDNNGIYDDFESDPYNGYDYGDTEPHTCKLRVTDTTYQTDMVTHTVQAVWDDPPNACYDWSDVDGNGAGTLLEFNASCSSDDNGIVEYAWDWENDGEYDDFYTTDHCTHNYGDTNLHTCKLRVTDTVDQTDTVTHIIQAYADVYWPMFHHDSSHTGYSPSIAPEENNTRWIYTTDSEVESSPVVINQKAYVGSNDSKVYCINVINGSFIWNYSTGGPVVSSPAVAADKVYTGSIDGNVYCLNANDGGYIWDYSTGGPVVSSPVVIDGKVYVGSNDGKVYCLDAETGGFIWDYATGDVIKSSPAVTSNKVYVGSLDNYIYCLNAENGSFIWDYLTVDPVESSPAIAYNKVYVGSNNGNVYCLDANDGGYIWDYSTGGPVKSSPAIANYKVYVGSLDNNVYCLDAIDGDYIWARPTNGPVESSPAIADDKVFVGSNDNFVYCLNTNSGSVIWSYSTGDYIKSSPAVYDKKVFVGSNDNKVYTFGNNPPNIPVNPSPFDYASDTGLNIILSVDVFDKDEDIMDVTFYDASDSSEIGIAFDVLSGSTASVSWPELDYGHMYSWYAIATDSAGATSQSDSWNFTTTTSYRHAPFEVSTWADFGEKNGNMNHLQFLNVEDTELFEYEWNNTYNLGGCGLCRVTNSTFAMAYKYGDKVYVQAGRIIEDAGDYLWDFGPSVMIFDAPSGDTILSNPVIHHFPDTKKVAVIYHTGLTGGNPEGWIYGSIAEINTGNLTCVETAQRPLSGGGYRHYNIATCVTSTKAYVLTRRAIYFDPEQEFEISLNYLTSSGSSGGTGLTGWWPNGGDVRIGGLAAIDPYHSDRCIVSWKEDDYFECNGWINAIFSGASQKYSVECDSSSGLYCLKDRKVADTSDNRIYQINSNYNGWTEYSTTLNGDFEPHYTFDGNCTVYIDGKHYVGYLDDSDNFQYLDSGNSHEYSGDLIHMHDNLYTMCFKEDGWQTFAPVLRGEAWDGAKIQREVIDCEYDNTTICKSNTRADDGYARIPVSYRAEDIESVKVNGSNYSRVNSSNEISSGLWFFDSANDFVYVGLGNISDGESFDIDVKSTQFTSWEDDFQTPYGILEQHGVILNGSAAVYKTHFFSDDFEDGNTSDWTFHLLDGDPDTGATTDHCQGNWGLRVDGDDWSESPEFDCSNLIYGPDYFVYEGWEDGDADGWEHYEPCSSSEFGVTQDWPEFTEGNYTMRISGNGYIIKTVNLFGETDVYITWKAQFKGQQQAEDRWQFDFYDGQTWHNRLVWDEDWDIPDWQTYNYTVPNNWIDPNGNNKLRWRYGHTYGGPGGCSDYVYVDDIWIRNRKSTLNLNGHLTIWSMDDADEWGTCDWFDGEQWHTLVSYQNEAGYFNVAIPEQWLSSHNKIRLDLKNYASGQSMSGDDHGVIDDLLLEGSDVGKILSIDITKPQKARWKEFNADVDDISPCRFDILDTSNNTLRSSRYRLYSDGNVLTEFMPYGETFNYQCVDETYPDDNLTYVWMANSSIKRDMYSLQDANGSGPISSVTVYTRAMCNSPNSFNGTYKVLLSNGTATVNESHDLNNSYQTFSSEYSTNPFTGQSWTWNDINNLQMGIECRSPLYTADYQLFLRPNGAGGYTFFTPVGDTTNWKCVDETAADDYTTYVKGHHSNKQKESYTMENHTSESGTINNVTEFIRCKGTGGTKIWLFKPMTRLNGIDKLLSAQRPNLEWNLYSGVFSTKPGGGAWTWTDIDNMEVGYEWSVSPDDELMTQVYAVVNYTASNPEIRTTQCYVEVSTYFNDTGMDIRDITENTIHLYGEFSGAPVNMNSWNVSWEIDDVPPEWYDQGQNKTYVIPGESISLYAQGRDDVALDWAWLATNETGEWQNITGAYGSTMKMHENNEWQWSNFTWQNTSIPDSTEVGWRIYYNDTSGNINCTGIMSFTVSSDFITIKGDCFYEKGGPTDTVEVEVDNLNTTKKWLAYTSANHYTLRILADDIYAGNILRIIATDDNASVNITDHLVTADDIGTGLIHLDLVLDVHYRDLKKFPMYLAEDGGAQGVNQMTGAATAQMMLNYLIWNRSVDPTPPMSYDNQTWIFENATEYNDNTSLGYIDAGGMHQLMLREIADQGYGYHFFISHNDTQMGIMLRICGWIDFNVSMWCNLQEGHPAHVPALIPAYGDYSNWMAIRGIHTNKNTDPYPNGPPENIEYYGFWVNDPLPQGIGENTYKTVDEFFATYYSPLSVEDDPYDGEYVAVTEPPEGFDDSLFDDSEPIFAKSPVRFSKHEAQVVQRAQKMTKATLIDDAAETAIFNAAMNAVQDIARYDGTLTEMINDVEPVKTIYVRRVGGPNYCIAVSGSDMGTIAVRISAKNGHLLEFSTSNELPGEYLSNLGIEDTNGMAFARYTNGSPFYPNVVGSPQSIGS